MVDQGCLTQKVWGQSSRALNTIVARYGHPVAITNEFDVIVEPQPYPPEREAMRSGLARNSMMATSTLANANLPADIMPVGPPPAITSVC